MAQRRKSKLYKMKLGQAVMLPAYEYGVSHISEKTKMKFIQRSVGRKVMCIRIG